MDKETIKNSILLNLRAANVAMLVEQLAEVLSENESLKAKLATLEKPNN